MAQRLRKRKCRNCRDFFMPDPRNIQKQKYCRKPKCRKASKAAAQARWLAKRENKNYFRGPENVSRVQEWRKRNPGYWRRKGAGAENALQDHSNEKKKEKQYVAKQLTKDALQDLLMTQHNVLVGLIAHLTGLALQDDIDSTTRCLQQLGADILSSSTSNFQGGDYASKNPYLPRADPPGS
jgi:hypothetical protein